MQAFRRIATSISLSKPKQLNAPSFTVAAKPYLKISDEVPATRFWSSGRDSGNGEDEWNEAWESAWLPEDLTPKSRAPWETDVNFGSPSTSLPESSSTAISAGVAVAETEAHADAETKAFVEEMNENWEVRRKKGSKEKEKVQNGAVYSVENMKKDYRLRKQRVHAGLWVKEIEKLEEAKLGDSNGSGGGDDIQRLLDSCSEYASLSWKSCLSVGSGMALRSMSIFDSGNNDLNNTEVPTSEFKNMPDGWETISKSQDGNIWEMSQREEDILLQEFERRIAYSKFQIASFIKTHIFSRRRPIDGWKYMIEVVGPNSKKGKGSVSRVPSLADPSTQPFKEKTLVDKNYIPLERR
ncbi:uncharacterized protein DS421_3g66830 [Arachis hypogaea]|nr:uncharacterized protein DS421_3g66830 [Arachis hypogaea]